MSSFPSFTAGDRVTAQKLNDMQAVVIMATASQSVNNTTTFVNDNSLYVPVLANASYFIEFFMLFQQSSTLNADVKTVWNAPSGTTGLRQVTGPTSSTTAGHFVSQVETKGRLAGHFLTTAVAYNMDNASGSLLVVLEKAVVNVAGTPGNIVIQWAQNTAAAQNLVRDTSSFVRVVRFT